MIFVVAYPPEAQEMPIFERLLFLAAFPMRMVYDKLNTAILADSVTKVMRSKINTDTSPMQLIAIKLRKDIKNHNIILTLVPKLQLGNAILEALASCEPATKINTDTLIYTHAPGTD